ncbi:MAG: hypothetical protein GWN58_67610, partial [Anaerolineae bacterium]|nr:hypothetical protein [Anaerolineae bacterium]
MGDLFQQGMANQYSAGDVSSLYNQELNTMRQAAQPEMDRQFNKLQDRLFAQGRL